jgi:hypothetical protein
VSAPRGAPGLSDGAPAHSGRPCCALRCRAGWRRSLRSLWTRRCGCGSGPGWGRPPPCQRAAPAAGSSRRAHRPLQVDLAADQDALPDDHVDILEGAQAQQQQGERPRITTRYMTKYEKARVLGTRALQIRWGRGEGEAEVIPPEPQRAHVPPAARHCWARARRPAVADRPRAAAPAPAA